jgi:hypothetical protein
LIERVLSFDCGEIITGRDHATVKDDELIFTRGQKNSLLWAATKGDAGEEDGGVVGDLRERQELHETGARRRSIVVIDFIEQPRLDVKFYFSSLEKNYTRSAGFGAAGGSTRLDLVRCGGIRFRRKAKIWIRPPPVPVRDDHGPSCRQFNSF